LDEHAHKKYGKIILQLHISLNTPLYFPHLTNLGGILEGGQFGVSSNESIFSSISNNPKSEI